MIYNIFSPEQEMILGDLNHQRVSGETRFVNDEKLLAYVREIGDRLNRHLPPTGLRFQFFIIDIPAANAFVTPGGYVFLSRKLIAFTKMEDELAGVVAHELGPATVRHGAADMSEAFKKILNVTTLGDPKDIAEKYNLRIERQRTKPGRPRGSHENAQQLEADRIGIFAMVAAGYDANAFSEFFSRLVEEKATSGNWFTNIFWALESRETTFAGNDQGDRAVAGTLSREPRRKCFGRFKTSAAFVRFSLDGKKLLVLTAGQVAHAFEIDRLVGK